MTRHVRARLDENILLSERAVEAARAVNGEEMSTDELDGLFPADSINGDTSEDRNNDCQPSEQ